MRFVLHVHIITVKIIHAAAAGGYGNYVVIEHYDGTKTRYAHCSTINVSLNQRVYNGKKIATVGSTGHSTGAHLHFEVYSNSTTRIDPLSVSYTVNSK